MESRRAEASRDGAPMVASEAMARMGVAELEACLKEALNPRMPVEVLCAILARLRSLEATRVPAESGQQML